MIRLMVLAGSACVALGAASAQETLVLPCDSTDELADRSGEANYTAEVDADAGRSALAVSDVRSHNATAAFAARAAAVAGRKYQLTAHIRTLGLSMCQVRARVRFLSQDGDEVGALPTDWAIQTYDWLPYRGLGVAPEGSVVAEVFIEAALSSLQPIPEGHRSGKALVDSITLAAVPDIAADLGRLGNVFELGQQVAGSLVVRDVPEGLRGTRVAYSIANHRGDVVWAGDQATLDQAATLAFDAGELPLGYYELQWAVLGGDGTLLQERASLAVVPTEAGRAYDEASPLALDAGFSWSYAGGGGDRLRTAARMARLAGLSCLRDRMSWSWTNPAPGEYRWGPYAEAAQAQADEGITVYQIMHDCPRWASEPPEGTPSPGTAPPQDLRDVFAFFERAASDLRDQVRYWEVWNEPDIFFFGGRASEYAGILKAAYLGAHRGSPEALVLNGSLAHPAGPWYERAMESGLSDYFDIFNMHYYGPTDSAVRRIDGNRAFLERYGAADKPIWITEMGVPAGKAPDGTFTASELEQAGYLVRSYAQSIGQGVDRFFFFYMHEFLEWGVHLWGIVRSDLTPKPAYVALASLTRELEGVSPVGRLAMPEGCTAYAFDTAQGTVVIAWANEQGTLPDNVSFATAVDTFGAPTRSRELSALPSIFRGVDLSGAEVLPPPANPGLPTASPERLEALSLVLDARVVPPNDSLPGDPARKEPPALAPHEPFELRLSAYNFGQEACEVTTSLELPDGWQLQGDLPSGSLAPGERAEAVVAVQPIGIRPQDTYALRFIGTSPGREVAPAVDHVTSRVDAYEPTSRLELGPGVEGVEWGTMHAGNLTMALDVAPAGGVCRVSMPDSGDRWAMATMPITEGIRLDAYDGVDLVFESSTSCPDSLVLILTERDGGQYMRSFDAAFAIDGPQSLRALYSQFALNTGVSSDANHRLDLSEVVRLSIGASFRQPITEAEWSIREVALVAF